MPCEICGKEGCDCSIEQRDVATDVALTEVAPKSIVSGVMRSLGGDFAWESGDGKIHFRCVGNCGDETAVEASTMEEAIRKILKKGWKKAGEKGLYCPRYPQCSCMGGP